MDGVTMKPGTKLLSHDGEIWSVARHDRHNPGVLVIRTHNGDHFFCPIPYLENHAKKLRWYHRLFRRLGWFQ
jgi:hypothetical protein